MSKIYVQYGCGGFAPKEWINFDASPTLRIQKIPFIGGILKNRLNVVFSPNVLYGDIIKGLPFKEEQCDGIFCSHVLEHLSLSDFRISLRNTFTILKKGGIFRCLVPDLEYYAREYINSLDQGDISASIKFIGSDTILGLEKRPRGLKGAITSFLGNSHHLWMWDEKSFCQELKIAGFSQIRVCKFNDCEDEMFRSVEEELRFINSVAIECRR
jgi:SAM-dependent methyltransferase